MKEIMHSTTTLFNWSGTINVCSLIDIAEGYNFRWNFMKSSKNQRRTHDWVGGVKFQLKLFF